MISLQVRNLENCKSLGRNTYFFPPLGLSIIPKSGNKTYETDEKSFHSEDAEFSFQ